MFFLFLGVHIFGFVPDCTRVGMIDEEKAGPVRLLGVAGYQDRSNDVVYCGPRLQNEGQDTVVYFGGDIQVLKNITF